MSRTRSAMSRVRSRPSSMPTGRHPRKTTYRPTLVACQLVIRMFPVEHPALASPFDGIISAEVGSHDGSGPRTAGRDYRGARPGGRSLTALSWGIYRRHGECARDAGSPRGGVSRAG